MNDHPRICVAVWIVPLLVDQSLFGAQFQVVVTRKDSQMIKRQKDSHPVRAFPADVIKTHHCRGLCRFNRSPSGQYDSGGCRRPRAAFSASALLYTATCPPTLQLHQLSVPGIYILRLNMCPEQINVLRLLFIILCAPCSASACGVLQARTRLPISEQTDIRAFQTAK